MRTRSLALLLEALRSSASLRSALSTCGLGGGDLGRDVLDGLRLALAGGGADDHVEQHHRPEAAADAVE